VVLQQLSGFLTVIALPPGASSVTFP
jgi:hypothetical protein